MRDITNREDIDSVVNAFYRQAMGNDEIGYIFTEVAKLDLEKHIPTICDFWESILFGKMNYRGSVVSKHIELHKLSSILPRHFEVWLGIWNSTIKESFKGEKADEMMHRAYLMAEMMKHKIDYYNHNPNMLI